MLAIRHFTELKESKGIIINKASHVINGQRNGTVREKSLNCVVNISWLSIIDIVLMAGEVDTKQLVSAWQCLYDLIIHSQSSAFYGRLYSLITTLTGT